MSEFVVALAWGMAVLAAYCGWGWLAARVLPRRVADLGAPQAADYLEMPAWGLAFSVAVGGILNLFSVADRMVACGYVAGGLLLAMLPAMAFWKQRELFWRRLRSDPPGLLMVLIIAMLLSLRLAASVIVPPFHPSPAWLGLRFNPHDDMHSYLVSLERMLQTGSMGLDPFNSRQMANALGGQHFLNELTIAVLPVDNVHMLESGIGLVALCLALGGLGLRLTGGSPLVAASGRAANSSFRAAAASMLVPLLIDWPYINISSMVTAAAALAILLSALHRVMKAREAGESAGRFLWLAGLALAAACSLKSTMIPVACLAIAAALVLLVVFTRKLRPLVDGVLIGAIALGLMAAWMIWQYRSAGTPLYPILGKGDNIETYFHMVSPSMPRKAKIAAASGVLLPACLLVGMGIAFCFRVIRGAVGKPLAAIVPAFLIAWIVEWAVLAQVTEMVDLFRYVASARAVGLALVLIALWRIGQELAGQFQMARGRFVGAIALAALVLWTLPEWTTFYVAKFPECLQASVSGRILNWDAGAMQLRNMQGVVPPGEKILAYLTTPAMLDFRRNTIYVADWPGESSPPPGMPLQQGSDAIAQYLLEENIRYVAYSYRQEANFPRNHYKDYVSPGYGRVVSRQAAESFLFQDALAEMARHRRIIFDDGANFVLDLAAAGTSPATTR